MTTVIFSPVQGLMWPTIELRVGRKGYEHSRVGLTRDDVEGGCTGAGIYFVPVIGMWWLDGLECMTFLTGVDWLVRRTR